MSAAASSLAVPATTSPIPRWRWGIIETFLVVQYLSTALLLVPGAQAARIPIRMIPYLLSGALLMFAAGRSPAGRPAGSRLVLLALGLLSINLIRPTTQPIAGLAQFALQCCIAAPIFWVGRTVQGPDHLRRILWVVFLANAVNVAVGILQVFYPDQFLPGEFNQLALASNPLLVEALTYTGASGRRIVRPPGLSDLPGGAAIAGVICMLFGVTWASQSGRRILVRLACLTTAVGGLLILLLTQVRSLFIMTVLALGAFAFLTARQGRRSTSFAIAGFGGAVVTLGFVLAVAIGGSVVSDRFLDLAEQGVLDSYSQNRGHFISYTITELLDRYTFGAGVGRWGVMNLYFGDRNLVAASDLYAEIQITGWLYDGGVLMWLFYGGAIIASLFYSYRIASIRERGELAFLAAFVFCCQLLIAGMAMAGPAFNTQFGIQFWTLAAALWAGVERHRSRARQTGDTPRAALAVSLPPAGHL